MKKYRLIKSDQLCQSNINIIPPVERIIAIGDIHGDLNLMIDSLIISNVIQEVPQQMANSISLIDNSNITRHYIWTGGNTVVVQVGDQIDRCRPTYYGACIKPETTYQDEASDMKILKFFSDLHQIAKPGAVYSLLGNHELMNAMGNMDYVSYLGLKEFSGDKKNPDPNDRIKAFKRGSTISKFLSCSRSAVIVIGSFLFVHAGFVSSLIKKGKNIHQVTDELNNLVKIWLLGNKIETEKILQIIDKLKQLLIIKDKENIKINLSIIRNEINQISHLSELDLNIINKLFEKINITDLKEIYHIIHVLNNIIKGYNTTRRLIEDPKVSPFWIRNLGNIPPNMNGDNELCHDFNNVMKLFNIKGMVIGHTPQLNIGINATCDNKLFRIDVASSKAFEYIIENNNNNDIRDRYNEGRKVQVLEILNDTHINIIKKNQSKTKII